MFQRKLKTNKHTVRQTVGLVGMIRNPQAKKNRSSDERVPNWIQVTTVLNSRDAVHNALKRDYPKAEYRIVGVRVDVREIY